MRGKEEMERGAGKFWGITPAYAGKSLFKNRAGNVERRITPAYAGKRGNSQ